MEVHSHAHPDSYRDHRKKWTNYFWEFIMLFLAVFCGFLAENIREHQVEYHRAKDFAESLVKDMQNDTAAILAQKKSAEIYITLADSLLSISQRRLEGRNAAEFSFYTRFMYWTVPVAWSRATFEQIKNSGSLRYFKNYQLLEKLMKYDGLVNEIEGEFRNHQTRGNMLLNEIDEIIDPQIHHDLSTYMLATQDTMSQKTRESFFAADVKSLENKREVIVKMLNMIVVQQRNLRFNNNRLQRATGLANEVVNELEKEYHLK
jgi:hypothetical protein